MTVLTGPLLLLGVFVAVAWSRENRYLLSDVPYAIAAVTGFWLAWTFGMGHTEVNWISGFRDVWFSLAALWGATALHRRLAGRRSWVPLVVCLAGLVVSIAAPLLLIGPRWGSAGWLMAVMLVSLGWLAREVFDAFVRVSRETAAQPSQA